MKPVLVPDDDQHLDLSVSDAQIRNVKWISQHAPERHTRSRAFDRYAELIERKKRANELRDKFSIVEHVSSISL